MKNPLRRILRGFGFVLASLAVLGTLAYFLFRLPPSPIPSDRFRGIELAHRGGYANGPENSLSTIRHHLELGVTGFEVDVQLSADGHPVLFHDSTLVRTTGLPGKPSDYTLVELQAMLLKGGLDQQDRIPSLAELLDLVAAWPDAVVELDLKHFVEDEESLLGSVSDLVMGHALEDRVLVTSFDPRTVYRLRRMAPDLLTGYAHTHHSGEGKLADWLLNLPLVPRFLGVAVVEPHHELVDADYVRYWTGKDKLVNAWTANTAPDKARLRELGVSITTNCPLAACEDDPSDHWGLAEAAP